MLGKLWAVFTGSVKDTSTGGKLNTTDWAKLIRNLILVVIGSALTFVIKEIPNLNLGDYTLALVPLLTFALDWINRIFKDNSIQTK